VKRAVLIVAAIAALLPAAATSATSRIQAVDTTGFPSVRITYVAPLGSGTPRLTENGRPVTSYQAVNLGRTKSVMVAIDRSQSMKGRPLANAVSAVQQFAASAGAADHVGVVVFGRSAVSLTRLATSGAEARDQIAGLTVDSKAGTALYDAIVLSANRLGQDPRPGRAIVVVSDGADVSSTHSLSDAVKAAQHAHAAIYTIGIAGPDFTSAALRQLASETGGSYRQASSSSQLAQTYTQLRDELARTWQLSYLTSARPGQQISLAATTQHAAARSTITLAGSSGQAAQTANGLIPSPAYGSAGTLLIGLAVGALMLLACGFWFAAQRDNRLKRRIEPHIAGSQIKGGKARRQEARAATRTRFIDSIENLFADVKQFKKLEQLIERADLPLRPGELLAICAGCGFGLGLIAAVLASSSLLILILMGVGVSAPISYVAWKARGRLRRFENQLPDLLITLAASLKAGHSFRQGIQSVVEEGAEPAADEFQRVLSETQLGKPMDDALAHMAERVGSSNLTFVITAVTIQRQIGGSLAGLFDMVAETVRQRQQFARKVRSLTAMGRMSAYVLVGLPFFMAAIVTLMNPTYMSPLWHTGPGHTMVISGLVMIGLGSLMLRKIASFRG
jgi:tight adherence protein B